ncbi:MAG: CoA transferase, partial [Anaerovorax sp.]
EDEKYSTFMAAYMNMEEFTKVMDEGFAKITQDQAAEALMAADIAHERVKQVKDIFQDEQAKANQYIADYIARDGRTYVHASSPVKF